MSGRGLYSWARSAGRRKASQSPSSKCVGLRMGREFGQIFIAQEISLALLSISLSVKFVLLRAHA